jgi:hypothetical protein
VERVAGGEERGQELGAEVGTDQHARLGHVAEAGAPFDDDERPGPPSRELGGRGCEQARHALVAVRIRVAQEGERAHAADAVETSPQLWLEDHHEGHQADDGTGLEDAREQAQVELEGEDVDGVDDGGADGQPDGSRALDEAQHEIDEDRGQEDVEQCARFDPQVRG